MSSEDEAFLVIEGEAGIGKTRLVQSIIDDARSRDVAVFCGQAHPFERARPFGVVAAALGLINIEQSGIISRYVTLLDPLKLGLTVSVFIQVSLEKQMRNALDTFDSGRF